jgi:hypothetical protein
MFDASLHSVAGMAKATSDTDRQAVVARLFAELKPHEGIVQNWFLDACVFPTRWGRNNALASLITDAVQLGQGHGQSQPALTTYDLPADAHISRAQEFGV